MLLQAKPFCLAPWACIHSTPDGNVYPCCMSTFSPNNAFGNLKDRPLAEILNSNKAKEFRKTMMQGKDHPACKHCVEEEKSGLKSYRNFWNTEYSFIEKNILKTNAEGFYSYESFPYIDIRLSNLCNFKCRMCHSDLSSSWLMEDLKNREQYTSVQQTIIETPRKEELFEFITNNIKEIKEIEFAGGEPFLINDYFKIINILKDNNNRNVKLRFHTNCSTLHVKGQYIPDLLKGFKNIFIMCSVDGYKKANDYSRKGSVYSKIIKNMLQLKKDLPHAYIRLVPTVSILTIYSLPFLYIDLLANNIINYKDISLRPLYGPKYLNIQTLELPEKIKILKFYQFFITSLYKKLSSNLYNKWFQNKEIKHFINEFNGIINFMFKQNLEFNRKDFITNITRLDSIRNENYCYIYPETAHLVNPNIIEYNINQLYNLLKSKINEL
jgi:radical SAM protein with 4Fe4S-binding SPASM domain